MLWCFCKQHNVAACVEAQHGVCADDWCDDSGQQGEGRWKRGGQTVVEGVG